MITVKNLVKYFRTTKAVDGISFNVEKGEIVGFLGPNAAGKTTTMRVISGYLYPTKGEVTVGGINVMEDPVKAKTLIGYMPENVPLYLDMPVFSYLGFFADLRGIQKEEKEKHILEVLSRVGIEKKLHNNLINTLSKGYRQRVGLAQALIGNPKVLILDEPTVGLDPNQILQIRKLIKELGKDHTIILSTHILQEVSAVCDRVIIISEGKLVAVDTQEKLLQDMESGQKNRLIAAGDFEKIKEVLIKINGVVDVKLLNRQNDENEIMVISEKGKDMRKDIASKIVKGGFSLLELAKMTLSLEEVFARLTKEK
ncbi:MAG: ATP-binding cassette domain-containing protein [Spirochaetes bacterium]|nr:ATP-binding cassette domain-containing protein [Spirochaetota bacterium]